MSLPMFDWQKCGLIFGPDDAPSWVKTHAQVPTALMLGDRLRVYYSGRPEPTLSMTTFVDLALDDPSEILHVHNDPVIPLGGVGCFDEFGVMPAGVLRYGGLVYMYYTGWSRGQTVPYLNAIGLAISEDDGVTFSKFSRGPVVERRKHEPFSAMSPCVIVERGVWHMWYSSGVGWHKGREKYEPIYWIKYARSEDGMDWEQPNVLCVRPTTPSEASTRPTVIKIGELYHMWFCHRGSEDFRGGVGSWRIGYAWSDDGVAWTREDERAGIDVSPDEWDGEMVEYPWVARVGDRLLMFYNGNGFGRAGFGYAEVLLGA